MSSKHVGEHQIHYAARHLFNPHLCVWKCGKVHPLCFTTRGINLKKWTVLQFRTSAWILFVWMEELVSMNKLQKKLMKGTSFRTCWISTVNVYLDLQDADVKVSNLFLFAISKKEKWKWIASQWLYTRFRANQQWISCYFFITTRLNIIMHRVNQWFWILNSAT